MENILNNEKHIQHTVHIVGLEEPNAEGLCVSHEEYTQPFYL